MSKFVRLMHRGDLVDIDLERIEVVRRIVTYTTEDPPKPVINGLRVFTVGSFDPYCFDDQNEMKVFLGVWDKFSQAQDPATFS